MITTVYLVRHAEPNFYNHNDMDRELTPKGLQDCQLLLNYFSKQNIHVIYSSPYRRAIETIKATAEFHQVSIIKRDAFRERKISSNWIEDFQNFVQKQWQDFSFKLPSGESLEEVQERTVHALKYLLKERIGEQIIISSHGTAISTIVNYFYPQFGLSDFQKLKHLFPFIIRMTFDKERCLSIYLDNIFTGESNEIYSI